MIAFGSVSSPFGRYWVLESLLCDRCCHLYPPGPPSGGPSAGDPLGIRGPAPAPETQFYSDKRLLLSAFSFAPCYRLIRGTKLASMPISRKKACRPCRIAKTRCSLQSPCARCESKRLHCDYRGNNIPGQSLTQTGEPNTAGWYDILDESHAEHEERGFGQLPHLDEIGHARSSISQNITDVGWNSNSAEVMDFEDIGTLEFNMENHSRTFTKPTTPESPAFLRRPSTMIDWQATPCSLSLSTVYPEMVAEDAIVPIATLIDSNQHEVARGKQSPRLLQPRTLATAEASLTAKILLGQLLSYPSMLVSSRKLPPFIYPPCGLGGYQDDCPCEGPHSCLPEALAVCAGLLHMFYKRIPGNWNYIWDQIYAHQRRLRVEVCSNSCLNLKLGLTKDLSQSIAPMTTKLC